MNDTKTHATNLRIRRAGSKERKITGRYNIDWGKPIPGVRTQAFIAGKQRRKIARLHRRDLERKAKEVQSDQTKQLLETYTILGQEVNRGTKF